MRPVAIEIISDFICPWCWIGHRNLRRAIDASDGIEFAPVRYLPYELNPSMPEIGLDRKAYRTAKFGSWERSQALDADVTLAGQRAGIDFNYDKVTVTPNTRLAHRLMRFAEGEASVKQIGVLYDSIFAAYFSEGQNIGSLAVLLDLAAASGLNREAARNYLESEKGVADVVNNELKAQSDGVRSVPYLLIGREHVSGAQGVAELTKVINAAAMR